MVICRLHADVVNETLTGDFVVSLKDVVNIADSVFGIACPCGLDRCVEIYNTLMGCGGAVIESNPSRAECMSLESVLESSLAAVPLSVVVHTSSTRPMSIPLFQVLCKIVVRRQRGPVSLNTQDKTRKVDTFLVSLL